MGMNPEVKAKWVAALRSGEYTQGKHCLREGDSYCCLGVLCDLHPSAAWDPDDQFGPSLESTIPPPEVAEWAGLQIDYPNPCVTINGITARIAVHNDNGHTFSEIADAIEAQL